MAPRRQAALAAAANLAAFAAEEASVGTPTKAPRSQALKAPKLVKARGKMTGARPAGPKLPDTGVPASTSIPLICVVCPSHPRFSDVSHLLTHLNSKGHLHTLNDVRIRAITDLPAAEAISTFDKWYNENGLEGMLAERLRVKDERAKGPNMGNRSGQPNSQNFKRKKALSLLVKREPKNHPAWTPPLTGRLLEQQAITFYGGRNSSPVSSPTDDVLDWTPDELESARLKGTVWPGMGIFDAATPDQKKKRNQRKDVSVLRKMELSSQAITTTELVANLDLEIERTRDVYDAPSVEGTPIAKSRRRQKRSRVVEEEDSASEIVVKPEPHDESVPHAARAKAVRSKKQLLDENQVPELDKESLSEKLDVASDAASNADADADVELDEDFDDSPFGPGSSLSNLNPHHHFNIPNEQDIFRDGSRGLAAPQKFSLEMMDEARFDVRNRIPLRSMNANSNLSLASPTPAAKQLPHRMFRGKENDHVLQGQRIPGDVYAFRGGNTPMNQAGTSNSNITANPFNGYQQSQEMYYQQPAWAYPPVTQTANSGFLAINGNPTQPMYYGTQFAFTAGENDPVNAAGMFGDGV